MSAIFLLSANDSPQVNNYEKCFLFHPASDLFFLSAIVIALEDDQR